MAGEEERQKAHEALQQQEADLACYAEQVAAQRQEADALQAKIKAMEDKVLHWGTLKGPALPCPALAYAPQPHWLVLCAC